MAQDVNIAVPDPSADMRPLLKKIGMLGVAQAQQAFRNQRLGSIIWPERYPGQSGPFINKAGAVADLSSGGRIKDRRFERRPAGIDTGELSRSMTYKVTGDDTVDIGSPLEYADRFHDGGESDQPITPAVRTALAKEMKRFRKQGGDRYDAVRTLGFLFRRDVLTTNAVARPFTGMTSATQRKIDSLVKEHFKGASNGRS